MIKKRIRQFLAGICTILVLPIGPVCEVFAKEEKQENSVSTESINQSLKLWYTSPANINTQETNGGEWMQQSLPLGNGNLGNLIFGGGFRKSEYILMKKRSGQAVPLQVVQVISSGIRRQHIRMRKLKITESF